MIDCDAIMGKDESLPMVHKGKYRTIFVLSRTAAEELIGNINNKYIVISIHDGKPPTFREDSNMVDLLTLHFSDISEPLGNLKMFDEVQAGQIFDFIERNNEIRNVIIHCQAGISRSAAVGAAIHFADDDSINSFFVNHAPNKYVFKEMLASYFRRQNTSE